MVLIRRGGGIASDDGNADVPVMSDELEQLKKSKRNFGLARKFSDGKFFLSSASEGERVGHLFDRKLLTRCAVEVV
jgi:hypothetical protein